MKVTLRPLTEVDCHPLWVRWLNDPEVTRYLSSKGRWTLPRLRKWFEEHQAKPGVRVFGICVGNQRVGTIKLEDVGSERWANLGLMIGQRSAQGQGVGTEAIRQAVIMCDGAGNLGLWAGMRTENIASFTAFLRAGFYVVKHSETLPAVVYETTRKWPPEPRHTLVLRRLRRVVK